MVESSTAKATKMALKLQAVHRWCAATASPLSCTACLQAALVEGNLAACMRPAAFCLTRTRRCVTGTPLSRGGLDDLYGLLAFLGSQPYCSLLWWRRMVQLPYENGSAAGVFVQVLRQRMVALVH